MLSASLRFLVLLGITSRLASLNLFPRVSEGVWSGSVREGVLGVGVSEGI